VEETDWLLRWGVRAVGVEICGQADKYKGHVCATRPLFGH